MNKQQYTNKELADMIAEQSRISQGYAKSVRTFEKEIRGELKGIRREIKPLYEFMIVRLDREKSAARGSDDSALMDLFKKVMVVIAMALSIVTAVLAAFFGVSGK